MSKEEETGRKEKREEGRERNIWIPEQKKTKKMAARGEKESKGVGDRRRGGE